MSKYRIIGFKIMDKKNSDGIRQAKSFQNGGDSWGISERREKKLSWGKR